jgi:hypothetical protein
LSGADAGAGSAEVEHDEVIGPPFKYDLAKQASLPKVLCKYRWYLIIATGTGDEHVPRVTRPATYSMSSHDGVLMTLLFIDRDQRKSP